MRDCTIYVAKTKALISCSYCAADLRLCFRICKKQGLRAVEDVLKLPSSLLATDRSKAVVLV